MPTKAQSSRFDRLRWTEQDARSALAALHRSGKPVSVFAAEHGLDPQRLYSWRRRLGKAEPTTFQELIVRPPPRISVVDGDAPFEVALPSGVVVRVPTSFNAAALERLLEVLQARAC
ncbi:MAG TPA: transposase [Polyangiaceae bacterium]|jgi:transposase-like protein|nr:transposase [Polyangiaceae bacterium]